MLDLSKTTNRILRYTRTVMKVGEGSGNTWSPAPGPKPDQYGDDVEWDGYKHHWVNPDGSSASDDSESGEEEQQTFFNPDADWNDQWGSLYAHIDKIPNDGIKDTLMTTLQSAGSLFNQGQVEKGLQMLGALLGRAQSEIPDDISNKDDWVMAIESLAEKVEEEFLPNQGKGEEPEPQEQQEESGPFNYREAIDQLYNIANDSDADDFGKNKLNSYIDRVETSMNEGDWTDAKHWLSILHSYLGTELKNEAQKEARKISYALNDAINVAEQDSEQTQEQPEQQEPEQESPQEEQADESMFDDVITQAFEMAVEATGEIQEETTYNAVTSAIDDISNMAKEGEYYDAAVRMLNVYNSVLNSNDDIFTDKGTLTTALYNLGRRLEEKSKEVGQHPNSGGGPTGVVNPAGGGAPKQTAPNGEPITRRYRSMSELDYDVSSAKMEAEDFNPYQAPSYVNTNTSGAIASYAGGGYGSINAGLRRGNPSTYDIKNIEEIVSKMQPLQEPQTLYRGMSELPDGFHEMWKEGAVIEADSFLSTSRNPEVALSFAAGNDSYAGSLSGGQMSYDDFVEGEYGLAFGEWLDNYNDYSIEEWASDKGYNSSDLENDDPPKESENWTNSEWDDWVQEQDELKDERWVDDLLDMYQDVYEQDMYDSYSDFQQEDYENHLEQGELGDELDLSDAFVMEISTDTNTQGITLSNSDTSFPEDETVLNYRSKIRIDSIERYVDLESDYASITVGHYVKVTILPPDTEYGS